MPEESRSSSASYIPFSFPQELIDSIIDEAQGDEHSLRVLSLVDKNAPGSTSSTLSTCLTRLPNYAVDKVEMNELEKRRTRRLPPTDFSRYSNQNPFYVAQSGN
jgi:hypothetical protein